MKILSINIGKAEPIASKSGTSGIFKKPQLGPTQINPLGLTGDTIVDTENHGGIDQAVYLYGQPDYDWWQQQLERDLAPGTFGENLTISDLHSAAINIGDRFVIGEVILEATSPRIPCLTFAARMDDKKFPKAFLAARRTGVYCRVLQTGLVRTGENIIFEPFEQPKIAIHDMLGLKNPDNDTLQNFLSTPLHHKSRAEYEAKLAR